MAEQHTLEVGNAFIVLTGMNEPFSDGHTTGYLGPPYYFGQNIR